MEFSTLPNGTKLLVTGPGGTARFTLHRYEDNGQLVLLGDEPGAVRRVAGYGGSTLPVTSPCIQAVELAAAPARSPRPTPAPAAPASPVRSEHVSQPALFGETL